MQRGDVVTADLGGGVGAEKDKVRPVLIVHIGGPTTLVCAVTDAQKKRIPTHALIKGYSSGTQVKDALVTCEHAWSVDPARLSPRDGARALTEDELRIVAQSMRVALGLTPARPTPGPPKHPRGAIRSIDFAGGRGSEPTGILQAVVVSNDTGNYFGRTLLVVPIVPDAHVPVPIAAGTADLGRLRVVDFDRVQPGDPGRVDPTEMTRLEAGLAERLPA